MGGLDSVLLLSGSEQLADWLAILDYGTFEVVEDRRLIPILGYAIAAPGHLVLVDTGFPREYTIDPEGAGRRDGLDTFGRLVSIGPQNTTAAQLARLDLVPADVTELVITHGDIDHVGGVGDFSEAAIVTSRIEREAGPPRYFGDMRPVAWPPDADYHLVTGDEELAPGVTLLSTPGHSTGHLSLLVRLPESGSILLACDAVSREHELESGINGGASDVATARESVRRLLEIVREEDALLVYGHDPVQSSELRWAPDVYR